MMQVVLDKFVSCCSKTHMFCDGSDGEVWYLLYEDSRRRVEGI